MILRQANPLGVTFRGRSLSWSLDFSDCDEVKLPGSWSTHCRLTYSYRNWYHFSR